MRTRNLRKLVYLLVMIPVLILPFIITSKADMGLVNTIVLLIIVSLGLNISLGLCGLLNVAQAAFWGIGAYTAAILALKFGLPFVITIPAAILLASALGFLVGIVSTRIKGIYFAILTIGFGLLIQLIFYNWQSVTNGTSGLKNIPYPDFGLFQIASRQQMYFILVFFAILTIWFYVRVAKTKYGKSMIAIRNNETAAELLGVDTLREKVLSMTLSSAIGGLCGALMIYAYGFVSPSQFGFDQNLIFILILILGGSGTVFGVVLGSLILVFLPQLLEPLRFWNTTIYGVLVAVMIMVLPGGLTSLILRVPMIKRLYERYHSREDDGEDSYSPSVISSTTIQHTTEPVLKVKDLSICFGGLSALSGVNLDLVPGQVHALIGPNGAGKSTLVNCITGVNTPSGGAIDMSGKSLLGLKPHKISRLGASRTFQNLAVWNEMSALDNMLVARRGKQKKGFWPVIFGTKSAREEEQEARNMARDLLTSMDLWEERDRLIGTLPYGHQKMLEIGRALMTEPKVLLLDEPAAGLTPPEVSTLKKLIQSIKNRGVAIMIIDHNMKFVMDIAEIITVLNYGKVITTDKPEAVRENVEVIEAYLGSGLKSSIKEVR